MSWFEHECLGLRKGKRKTHENHDTIVDDFLDWSSYDRTWPHGGYEADVEKDGNGSSNKENEWVVVLVDE